LDRSKCRGNDDDALGREHNGDHAWHYKQWENPSQMNPALDMPTSTNGTFVWPAIRLSLCFQRKRLINTLPRTTSM